jgi:L,D-transpeptidase-like protein
VSLRILAAAAAMTMLSLGAPARAAVLVTIDKATQRMTVAVDGATRHVFAVSTGRAGFGTPNGHFRPQRLARTWFSKKYYDSPMPHSIFFHGGYAIHGSYEIRRLGGPASHGCVRLHPANAAVLFALVQGAGAGNTRIVVTGGNPAPARSLLARAPSPSSYYAPRMAPDPAYHRPPYHPVERAPIYQDPASGTLWTFGAGGSVRIIAR